MTLCGRLCSTPWRPTSGSTSQLIGERIDEEERGLSSDASTETPTREVKDHNSTPAAVHITQSIRVSDRNEAVRSNNTQTGIETKVGLFRRTEAETEAGFQLSSSLSFSFFLSFSYNNFQPAQSENESSEEKSKGCIIRLSLTAADRHLCLCASTHFPSLAFGPKCRTTYFLLQQILKWHSGLLVFHVHKGEGAWERQIKHRKVQIRAGEDEISLKNWILQLPKCSSIASSSLFFFRSSLTRGITTCFKLHTLKLAMQALSPATSFRKAPPGREKAFQSGETRGSEVKTAFITVDDTW